MYESTEGVVRAPQLHAKATSALLAGMVGVEIGYAWWGWKLRAMLDPAAEEITDAGFMEHLSLGESLDKLNLIGILVTGVVFAAWMYRAYKNLPALGPVTADYSAEKALYGWVIPIMGLIIPYQVIRELWDRTGAARGEGDRDDGTVVLVWWLGWLCMSVMNWGLHFMSAADTVDSLRSHGLYVIVLGAVSAVTGCLAIVVVRRTTARLAACEGPRAQAL